MALQETYDPTPNIHRIPPGKEAVAAKDVADCVAWAKAGANRKYSLTNAASAAGQGSAENLSTAAVPGTGWLGPVLGGVGGVLSYSAAWAGILTVDQAQAAQGCVRAALQADGAGILVEAPL